MPEPHFPCGRPPRRHAREIVLALIVAGMILAIGLRAPVFLSLDSIRSLLDDTAVLAMLVLAQMAVILIRGIDLSVAANLALSGMAAALFAIWAPGLPISIVILAAIAVGAFFGFLNGVFIAWIGIPSIVVTLGTLAIYRGLFFIISGGKCISDRK